MNAILHMTTSGSQVHKRVLFVINKAAGTGYKSRTEMVIKHAALNRGIDCTLAFTEGPGHAITLSRNGVAEKFDQIVAVGGDGTSNEVAQGLVHTQIPMGIIPSGSGNGLARHLGISLGTAEAVEQIFDSDILPIDTFTINGKLSLNVSGIGFDGHITNLFGIKSRRGLMGYIKLAIHEFLNFKEFGTTIEMDHRHLNRNAFIVAIANSSQYGNNARIVPMASVTDGILHLNIVKKIPIYRMDFVYQFFKGELGQSSFCEIMGFQAVCLKTDTAIAFHVDGEPAGLSDTFEIKLQRNSLNVLVPRPIP